MKYNTIIFDLDGTISNTESGIFKAFRKMMKEFGVDESKFDLKKFIGPPIQWSFYQIFGDDMRLFKALDYFRGVYLDFMTDNTLYDGVKELLEKLAADGFALGVATSKYEPYAVKVLKELGVLEYFGFVFGSIGDRNEKADVRRAAIEGKNLDVKSCLLVGDTLYDMRGAAACGMDVLGVTYGFGRAEDFEEYNPVAVCENTKQIYTFIKTAR